MTTSAKCVDTADSLMKSPTSLSRSVPELSVMSVYLFYNIHVSFKGHFPDKSGLGDCLIRLIVTTVDNILMVHGSSNVCCARLRR